MIGWWTSPASTGAIKARPRSDRCGELVSTSAFCPSAQPPSTRASPISVTNLCFHLCRLLCAAAFDPVPKPLFSGHNVGLPQARCEPLPRGPPILAIARRRPNNIVAVAVAELRNFRMKRPARTSLSHKLVKRWAACTALRYQLYARFLAVKRKACNNASLRSCEKAKHPPVISKCDPISTTRTAILSHCLSVCVPIFAHAHGLRPGSVRRGILVAHDG